MRLMAKQEMFYIRGHHLKYRITADVFSDKSPEELADEWIAGIDQSPRSRDKYQTFKNPVVRRAMRDGFMQHIRDIRAGKTPIVVEGSDSYLDPICSQCINAWCGDSTVYRSNL